jgi:glyoxylase-like metal-dependent hydrolase (beta-lactamase superfamily II)
MIYTLTVGSIRCHLLSDGLHHADGGGFFGLVPRLMWQRVIEPDHNNIIPTDTRALLIESAAGPLLVDTGYGDKLDARSRTRLGIDSRDERLVRQMRAVGIAPEDVTTVILTHFHGDHCGGATRYAEAGNPQSPVVATFPNARYLGQRIDLADASFPNERTSATYLADNFQPLLASGALQVVSGPQRVAPGVRTQMAPGHTHGLQIVWVEDRDESLLFLGDAANWAVHLERLAWVPAYDIDPMTAIETKRALRDEALARHTLLAFQHDARVVTARLAAGEKGLEVRPEITKKPHHDDSLEAAPLAAPA